MIPVHKAGEFFGLFGVLEKFAGVLGPAVFGLSITLFGSSRMAMLTLIAFFVAGGLLLSRVDVEAGRRLAAEEG
jgi:UMF1 family MFS transporter